MNEKMTVRQALSLLADADDVIVESLRLLAHSAREGNQPRVKQFIGVIRDMSRVHREIRDYVRQQERRQAAPKTKQENLNWALIDAVPRI